MLSYRKLRPALFMLPPERAHRAAIHALKMGIVPQSEFTHPWLHTNVAGLHFTNPVGLAAGFDKNAECVEGCMLAGFGFVEIGTVTPRAQPGNPAPRLFRLAEEEAVINRLGFNNEGVEAAAKRLKIRSGGILGGNIGRNKDSTDAIADYTFAMKTIYPHVDYITANISSPNTPGLRALQAADELQALIGALQNTRGGFAKHKPIFVKIAPDCDAAMLAAIADVAKAEKLDGLIISNTTITRDGVEQSKFAGEAGGLSGKPLFQKSTDTLRTMYKLTEGTVPLIGVGGISSALDAYTKIRAGASLIQLYTGLIYKGFGLVEEINRGLIDYVTRDKIKGISHAVGADV